MPDGSFGTRDPEEVVEELHAAIERAIEQVRGDVSASVSDVFPGDVVDAPRCLNCPEEPVAHGLCGPCLHDALRSGWEPGRE